MIFKPRSKSNKNYNNEATKNKKKKTKKDNNEEDPTISGREKVTKVGNRKANATNMVAARGSERSLQCEEGNGEEDLRSETDGQEDAAENVPEQEEEEKMTPPEHAEPLGTAEISATVEAQSKTKDTEDQGEADADGGIEKQIEMDEVGDKDEGDVIKCTAGERAGVEVCSKEITVESSAPNPEETQEAV